MYLGGNSIFFFFTIRYNFPPPHKIFCLLKKGKKKTLRRRNPRVPSLSLSFPFLTLSSLHFLFQLSLTLSSLPFPSQSSLTLTLSRKSPLSLSLSLSLSRPRQKVITLGGNSISCGPLCELFSLDPAER